jgi:uncharacterized protein with NRDE domain
LAFFPQKVKHQDVNLYYPIDPQSNGTWFCVKENGNVFVLLNGAEKKHISDPPYRMSRGQILIEFVKGFDGPEFWQKINLKDIEPFTIIVFAKNKLYQLWWNGKTRHTIKLTIDTPYIWSSATLYPDEIRSRRKIWFQNFLKNSHYKPASNELFDFHIHTQKDDRENGLVINRDQKIMTKNITQCILEHDRFVLHHLDLVIDKKATIQDVIVSNPHETSIKNNHD